MSLARALGKPRDTKTFEPDERLVLPATLLGLEFEYEKVLQPDLPHDEPLAGLWTRHDENSLKDNGAEFVFAAPLFGKDAYNATEWLMKYAKSKDWECSVRAGIHVHMDVRDVEVNQLIGMLLLYAALEPVIYNWIGDNRENSVFCVPLYKADEALLDAAGIISSALRDEREESNSVIDAAENFERYAGLNLQALAKFGSLEFRHMKTTHNFQRVIDWLNIIMSFKAAAFKLPTSDGAVVRMCENMRPWELLDYVFGGLADKLWTNNIEELVHEQGIPSARDLALHGCSKAIWNQLSYPKGENSGFKKFMEKKPPLPEGPPAAEQSGNLQSQFASSEHIEAALELAQLQAAANANQQFVGINAPLYAPLKKKIKKTPTPWSLEAVGTAWYTEPILDDGDNQV